MQSKAILDAHMIDMASDCALETAIKTDQTLKETLESSAAELKLGFEQELVPTTSHFTYLVVLCPELNWQFLKACDGTDLRTVTSLVATMSTLHGQQINTTAVAMVRAQDLALESQYVNAFVDLLVGEDPITADGLSKINGVIPFTAQLASWFPDLARPVLMMPTSILGLESAPVLVIGQKGLTAVVIKRGQGSAQGTSQLTSEVVLGAKLQSPLFKHNLELHLLGALIVEGWMAPIGPQKQNENALLASWQLNLDLSSTAQENPVVVQTLSQSYNPIKLTVFVPQSQFGTDWSVLLLLQPFPLAEGKEDEYSFATKSISYAIKDLKFSLTGNGVDANLIKGVTAQRWSVLEASTLGEGSLSNDIIRNGGWYFSSKSEMQKQRWISSSRVISSNSFVFGTYTNHVSVNSTPQSQFVCSVSSQAIQDLSITSDLAFSIPTPYPPRDRYSGTWNLFVQALLRIDFTVEYVSDPTVEQSMTLHVFWDSEIQEACADKATRQARSPKKEN